jgi:hypothetical protein
VKVWLDDQRAAPEGWVHVRTPEEAIRLLRRGEVEELSLDHDLGLDVGRASGRATTSSSGSSGRSPPAGRGRRR